MNSAQTSAAGVPFRFGRSTPRQSRWPSAVVTSTPGMMRKPSTGWPSGAHEALVQEVMDAVAGIVIGEGEAVEALWRGRWRSAPPGCSRHRRKRRNGSADRCSKPCGTNMAQAAENYEAKNRRLQPAPARRSAMISAMSIAFKEWAIICDSLGVGRPIDHPPQGRHPRGSRRILLQARRSFSSSRLFHEQVARTSLPAATPIPAQPAGRDPHPAICPAWNGRPRSPSLETALALAPFHVWNEEVVRERFNYDEAPGVHLAFLRVFRCEPGAGVSRRAEIWRLPLVGHDSGCAGEHGARSRALRTRATSRGPDALRSVAGCVSCPRGLRVRLAARICARAIRGAVGIMAGACFKQTSKRASCRLRKPSKVR